MSYADCSDWLLHQRDHLSRTESLVYCDEAGFRSVVQTAFESPGRSQILLSGQVVQGLWEALVRRHDFRSCLMESRLTV